MSDRRPQMHYSSLALLNRCGIAFEFKYEKKIKVPPTAALHVGRAVDNSAALNLENKIENDALLPSEQVIDVARDNIVHAIENEGLAVQPGEIEGEAKAEAIDKTVRLAAAHAKLIAPKIKPKRVRARWSLEIPGLPFDLVGERDVDDTEGAVRDLKTSGRSPASSTIDSSLQMSTYSLSKYVIEKAELPIPVRLDFLVDLKRGVKYITLESDRGRQDFEALYNRLENAALILEKGAFTPTNPERDPICSPVYCPYHSRCPYVRRPKQFVIEERE